MKKEQFQVLILGGLVLILLAWALQLNSSLKGLKKDKKEIEAKLIQVTKEKDFMQARLEELEKKLAEEKKASALLSEQLVLAKDTIQELQGKIMEIAHEKEVVEKELMEIKNKANAPQVTPEPELSLPTPTSQPSASPEESYTLPEEIVPEF
ncbi:MAG: hypothetical protein NC920_05265 [Candidatus Omnitrophica bacterium]|nr:hypothetical protein [Candidatus Omnitrophota bacterium]